jgi:asparagine synthase (glutamine-hydrolysing)
MCRIAVALSNNIETLKSRITAMTDAMQRGGPDDFGLHINTDLSYALGHRRLSIIDLSSAGHQPMIDDVNKIEIVFNGEIYNYKLLKLDLESLGHIFFSDSDTEVIIKGYKEWGIDLLLNKLRGMFAFVLIDLKKNLLFAARDYAGIKPLYIARNNEEIFFSSEVRGIKALDIDWKENSNWPIWFLTFGFLPEPITTLEKVEQIPRGNYITIDLKTRRENVVSYCNYNYNNVQETYSNAVVATRTLVDESVKRHLVSDVPVGVFLSGGIDSSILTIAAQRHLNTSIETVSIYFDDEKYSEKEFQDIIIKQTGVKHHSFKVTKDDFINDWATIFESIDQPSTDAINTHYICKFANQIGLKVVLSGLGADEIFGGYPSKDRALKFNIYQRLALINKFLLAGLIASSYPKKKIEFLNKKIAASEYLLYRGLFTPKDTALILGVDEKIVWNELSKFKFNENILNLNSQNRAAYYETAVYMQSQLLRDSDIQSMWYGLELRVPFLDRDLMEYVNNLAPELKFQKSQNKPKPLLVDAYINELPNEIWNRPKKGFTFPFENWFAEMDVFKNIKIIPNWAYTKFKNGKLNFSRLWAIFLIKPSTLLTTPSKVA